MPYACMVSSNGRAIREVIPPSRATPSAGVPLFVLHPPSDEADGAMRLAGNRRVMRHHDHRQALLGVERSQVAVLIFRGKEYLRERLGRRLGKEKSQ